jgi:dihydroorotase
MTYDPDNKNLLVRGGQLLTPSGLEETDILISNGLVSRIAPNQTASKECATLDASGQLVFPGPIDPQVHFREPGGEEKEDLASGSAAAIAGGVTAFCEMPNTNPSTTNPAALEDKFARARGRSRADYAFFLGASPENADRLGEWECVPGCAGVKVFMGSSTGDLLVEDDATLERVLRSGTRRVTVHSEDNLRLSERYAALTQQHPTGAAVAMHPEVRDVECAVRSTKRLLTLAEKTNRPVHLLHVSTAEELDLVRERDLGELVTVEATPNHLFLTAPECYTEYGTWAQMNPPVRDARHRDALRQALVKGPVTCIGSDHAPHTAEEKARSFPNSPSGIPGVQTTLALLLTAVRDGWLQYEDILRLCVTGPIKVYGIENRGPLAPGLEGNLILVNPDYTGPLRADWLLSRSPCNPFIGRELAGLPTMAVLRGQVVMRAGIPVGPARGEPLSFA